MTYRSQLVYCCTQNALRIRLFLSHSSISIRGEMAWGVAPPPPCAFYIGWKNSMCRRRWRKNNFFRQGSSYHFYAWFDCPKQAPKNVARHNDVSHRMSRWRSKVNTYYIYKKTALLDGAAHTILTNVTLTFDLDRVICWMWRIFVCAFPDVLVLSWARSINK